MQEASLFNKSFLFFNLSSIISPYHIPVHLSEGFLTLATNNNSF